MSTPARYAIVGSGNIGTALARLFARAGIEVGITNTRGPESLRQLTAAVQLGRIDEGGRLIQAPNALVLRNLIERPL